MWTRKITTFWLLPAILAASGAVRAGSKPEYPCTVYRAADFEHARRNIARFPWAKEIYEETKSKGGYYLAMDSEKITTPITPRLPAGSSGKWPFFTTSSSPMTGSMTRTI